MYWCGEMFLNKRCFSEHTLPDAERGMDAAFFLELYTDFRNQLLILHGTKDEIVPIDAVRQFAEQNGIPFIPITNADHRFVDPGKMKESIEIIQDFFWPYSGSDELFNE